MPPPSVGGNQLSTTANTQSFQPLVLPDRSVLPDQNNFFLAITYNRIAIHTKTVNYIPVNRATLLEIVSLSTTFVPVSSLAFSLSVPWSKTRTNRWQPGEVALSLRGPIQAWRRGNIHLTGGLVFPGRRIGNSSSGTVALATQGTVLHRVAVDGWRFKEQKYILGLQGLLDIPVQGLVYDLARSIMQVSLFQRDQRFARRHLYPSLQITFRRDKRPRVGGWFLLGSAGLDFRPVRDWAVALNLRGPLVTGIEGLAMRQVNLSLNITWIPE